MYVVQLNALREAGSDEGLGGWKTHLSYHSGLRLFVIYRIASIRVLIYPPKRTNHAVELQVSL